MGVEECGHGVTRADISYNCKTEALPNQLGSEKFIYPNYWFIKNLTEITLVETTLASDHNSTALTHFTTRKAVRSLETAKQSIILQNFTYCSFRNLFLTANKTCQHFWIQVGKFYYCFSSFA